MFFTLPQRNLDHTAETRNNLLGLTLHFREVVPCDTQQVRPKIFSAAPALLMN